MPFMLRGTREEDSRPSFLFENLEILQSAIRQLCESLFPLRSSALTFRKLSRSQTRAAQIFDVQQDEFVSFRFVNQPHETLKSNRLVDAIAFAFKESCGTGNIRLRIPFERGWYTRHDFGIREITLSAEINRLGNRIIVRALNLGQVPFKLQHEHPPDSLLLVRIHKKILLDLRPFVENKLLRADVLKSFIKLNPKRRQT